MQCTIREAKRRRPKMIVLMGYEGFVKAPRLVTAIAIGRRCGSQSAPPVAGPPAPYVTDQGTFPSSGGLRIRALLARPDGEGPFPAYISTLYFILVQGDSIFVPDAVRFLDAPAQSLILPRGARYCFDDRSRALSRHAVPPPGAVPGRRWRPGRHPGRALVRPRLHVYDGLSAPTWHGLGNFRALRRIRSSRSPPATRSSSWR